MHLFCTVNVMTKGISLTLMQQVTNSFKHMPLLEFSLIILIVAFSVLLPRFLSMPGYGQLYIMQETLNLLRYLFCFISLDFTYLSIE